jgi:hypothetical protein
MFHLIKMTEEVFCGPSDVSSSPPLNTNEEYFAFYESEKLRRTGEVKSSTIQHIVCIRFEREERARVKEAYPGLTSLEHERIIQKALGDFEKALQEYTS